MNHFLRIFIILAMDMMVISSSLLADEADNRWAFLIQSVAPGQTKNVYDVLTNRYDYPNDQIVVLGTRLESIRNGTPSRENIRKHFKLLRQRLKEGDFLFLFICTHAKPGFVIGEHFNYYELNNELEKLEGVKIAVVIEACHSGLALGYLSGADIIYTACTGGGKCYGGFIMRFAYAIGAREDAFKKADVNHDKKVSLGEAFDYANDMAELKIWYDSLDRKVWPTTYIPRPQRNKSGIDYSTWLLKLDRKSDSSFLIKKKRALPEAATGSSIITSDKPTLIPDPHPPNNRFNYTAAHVHDLRQMIPHKMVTNLKVWATLGGESSSSQFGVWVSPDKSNWTPVGHTFEGACGVQVSDIFPGEKINVNFRYVKVDPDGKFSGPWHNWIGYSKIEVCFLSQN